MYCTIYVLAAGLMVVQVKHISQISNTNILAVKHEKNLKYTNSLVNAGSFYTNFPNTTFQKIPIPHLTRPMKQKFLQ